MSEQWAHFEDPAEAKGFALIQNAVMRDPSLSMQAKYVYGLLKSFAWQDPSTYPGVKTLCGAAGVSKDTLGKYLKELVDENLIEVKRRGQGKTNLYIFKRVVDRHNPDGDTGSHQDGEKGSHQDGDASSHNEYAVDEDPVTSPRASTSADALSLQKKEWKKEAVAQLVERIYSECSTELAEAYKGRWARDVGRFLEKARTSEALDEHMAIVDEATDRAVARYDDYPLSFADAQRDCQKGRGGNAPPPTAIEQADGTPQEVIEYVFANTRNSVLRDGEKRIRLAMSRFDFTSGEQPPFPVQVQIGGSEQERWNVLDSINALCRRALREAKGAA